MLYYEIVNGIFKISQIGGLEDGEVEKLRKFMLSSESKIKFVEMYSCEAPVKEEVRLWGFDWSVLGL